MIYDKISLEEHFPALRHCELTLYIPGLSSEIDLCRNFPCVIICPGGGYEWVSEREAEPAALRFLGKGIAAAVLRYSCGGGAKFPDQLLQVSAAVAYIRKNAAGLHILSDKIAVMGFSAGGHAAASAALMWQEDFVKTALGIKGEENRPNGMILCYPVIIYGENAHRDSFVHLLGEDFSEERAAELSLEKAVTENAPKAFIWHTDEDGLVPAENSLELALALRKKHIPTELHIYPYGRHGLSLCDETCDKPENVDKSGEYCSGWTEQCIRWIKNIL